MNERLPLVAQKSICLNRPGILGKPFDRLRRFPAAVLILAQNFFSSHSARYRIRALLPFQGTLQNG
jgi:hypothetical protein